MNLCYELKCRALYLYKHFRQTCNAFQMQCQCLAGITSKESRSLEARAVSAYCICESARIEATAAR